MTNTIPECPVCGVAAAVIGTLGSTVLYRCRACGTEWRTTPDPDPTPRGLKRPTFARQRETLLKAFADFGWEVTERDYRTGRPLKVPHATNPEGDIRLWFKPQSVYYAHITGQARFDLGSARSIESDIRTTNAEILKAQAERWAKMEL